MAVERPSLIHELSVKYINLDHSIKAVEATLMPPGYMVSRTEEGELLIDEQFLKGMYNARKGLLEDIKVMGKKKFNL